MKNQKKPSFFGSMSFFKKNESVPQNDKIPKEENTAKLQTADLIDNTYVKKETGFTSEKVVGNTQATAGFWEYPPISLLTEYENTTRSKDDFVKIATIIEQTADVFGIGVRVIEVNLLTFYDQFVLEFTKSSDTSKIYNLVDEFAYVLDTPSNKVKILKYINDHEKDLITIEVAPNYHIVTSLKSILPTDLIRKSCSKLVVGLGLDTSARPVATNIAKLPHLLITGTTDSGISNVVHLIIATLLFRASPLEVKLILIDPKRVELTGYNNIPHLLTPVIVEVEKILSALKWVMGEMDRRYKIFAERGVKNIDSYNELSGFQALPYIVIVIDELADLMAFAPVEVEDVIIRLIRMGHLTGIHLILASKESRNNLIKNMFSLFSSRIIVDNFSTVDNRNIFNYENDPSANGYTLTYFAPDVTKSLRLSSTIVSEDEVKRLVEFLKTQVPLIDDIYTDDSQEGRSKGREASSHEQDDSLMEEAIRVVCQHDRASASLLQRRLSIGYSRAARILDQLEEAGVVGPGEGSKPRDVLTTNAEDFIKNRNSK